MKTKRNTTLCPGISREAGEECVLYEDDTIVCKCTNVDLLYIFVILISSSMLCNCYGDMSESLRYVCVCIYLCSMAKNLHEYMVKPLGVALALVGSRPFGCIQF